MTKSRPTPKLSAKRAGSKPKPEPVIQPLLGTEVSELRLRLNATQQQMANALGKTLRSYQYWEERGVDVVQSLALQRLEQIMWQPR